MSTENTSRRGGLTVAGLFAGIGGIERGLHAAGHDTSVLCEKDEAAARVLAAKFSDVPIHGDIAELRSLPRVDLVAAGFPCQDLSQAGRTAGIDGTRSGLVRHVFRLIRSARPTWLMLENVSFMLSLDNGRAMEFLVRQLAECGYRNWAYRVVDSRAFGLPQRRQRVILLASRTEDPRAVLLADDMGIPPEPEARGVACGFYWTEGTKGLGWAIDAVPTLKGGSTVGIPSPPAIWMPDGRMVTPEIRDAEQLQGFPAGWTEVATQNAAKKNGPRWKLVGNAVSVPVAHWVGTRLSQPGHVRDSRLWSGTGTWPRAAWSLDGGKTISECHVSAWPERRPRLHLADFLTHEPRLLSARATAGFLSRAEASTLRFADGFLRAVRAHLRRMLKAPKAA